MFERHAAEWLEVGDGCLTDVERLERHAREWEEIGDLAVVERQFFKHHPPQRIEIGNVHCAGVERLERHACEARLYRAMILFRAGKLEEARKLFHEAETKMPPLPKNAGRELPRNVNQDQLLYWLAHREAKALLFEPATTEK